MSERAGGGGRGAITACVIVDVHARRSISVSLHHDGVAHQTSLRSRRTMMTRANSLHAREAGSLISLPVTHDHDPRKHPRTGATVMTAVVGYGGRTRRTQSDRA